jgi:hypothetical protein
MKFSAPYPSPSPAPAGTASPSTVEKATDTQVAGLRPTSDDDPSINGQQVLFVGKFEARSMHKRAKLSLSSFCRPIR